MKKIIITSIVLLAGLGFAIAALILSSGTRSTLAGLQYDRDAYQLLCKAQSFSFTGVSYGMEMSDETAAYAKLYESPDAEAVFRCLEQDANTEGKLYALCAFYTLDNNYYNQQVENYLTSDRTVRLISGCLGSYETLSNLMKSPDNHVGVGFTNGEIPQILNAYIAQEDAVN